MDKSSFIFPICFLTSEPLNPEPLNPNFDPEPVCRVTSVHL